MKKSKCCAVFLLACIMLSFCSCIGEETEIKNRLIIEGIGIDYSEETKQYTVTVQSLATQKAQSSDDNSGSAPIVNYTVSGDSVSGALASLCESTGKNPLYSQNRIIVLGFSLTESKIAAALDFLVREYTSNPAVYVAAAKDSAKEILSVETGSEIPAKAIEDAILKSAENSLTRMMTLYDAVNLIKEETTVLTMPLLTAESSEEESEKVIKVKGAAAVTGKTETVLLSAEECMLLSFMLNEAKGGTLSFISGDSQVGLDIISAKTKINTKLKNGNVHYDIKISCKLDLVEYGEKNFDSINEELLSDTEKKTQVLIEDGMKKLLDKMIKEEKCDIFRLGKRFLLKYPTEFSKHSKDYRDFMQLYEFDVTADTVIRKIGQEAIRG